MSRPRELGREAGNDTNLSAHGSDGGAKTKLRVRINKGSASHASIRILLKATPPSQTRKRFETKKPRDSQEPRGFCCARQTERHLHCATAKPLRISSVPPSVLAFTKAQLGHTPGTSRRKGRCSISCESNRTWIREEHCFNGSRCSSGTKTPRRRTECEWPSATRIDPDRGQKKVNWEPAREADQSNSDPQIGGSLTMIDDAANKKPGTHLVEVFRAENSIAAHFFKNALEDAGIAAYITDESIAATESFPMWWSSPRILVDAADAERAAAIIRELESARRERHARDRK
jgi:hypothetical protein